MRKLYSQIQTTKRRLNEIFQTLNNAERLPSNREAEYEDVYRRFKILHEGTKLYLYQEKSSFFISQHIDLYINQYAEY